MDTCRINTFLDQISQFTVSWTAWFVKNERVINIKIRCCSVNGVNMATLINSLRHSYKAMFICTSCLVLEVYPWTDSRATKVSRASCTVRIFSDWMSSCRVKKGCRVADSLEFCWYTTDLTEKQNGRLDIISDRELGLWFEVFQYQNNLFQQLALLSVKFFSTHVRFDIS